MSIKSTYPLAGQRTRIDPTAVIQSPAFQTTYPSVRNLEIVPEGVRHAMEESWKRGLFEPRDIEIFCIPGACVSEECLVFDAQLRVIENASDTYTDEEIEVALGSIFRLLDAERLPHLPDRGVVAKRRAANNYGHFLLEMLPMAVVGAALPSEKERKFLLHRVEPPMLDVMLRSFRLLGITPDRLLFPDMLEPMRFEELVVVRGLTAHGTYMSQHCVNAVGRLAAKIAPSRSKERLFVKRRPGWKRGRSVVNEAELESRLAAAGFRSIEPSALSLEEQIAEFSSADEVVGVSGAAMTNIVFCCPGTRVVNLVSSHFPDTFFWFIATHRGLNYSEIRGDAMSGEVLDTISDFRIREPDIVWLEHLHQQSENHAHSTITAHVHDVGDVQGGICSSPSV